MIKLDDNYANIITFIKELERLKNTLRTAWTSTGRREKVQQSILLD